jgi:hypothetical protein
MYKTCEEFIMSFWSLYLIGDNGDPDDRDVQTGLAGWID